MEAINKLLFALVLVALISEAALATQHVVGGSQGWDESTDFSSWASGQKFKVGDQLVFKYTSGLHNVIELGSEMAYKNCDISSSVDSLNGGNNVVKLNKPGSRYFACGTTGHCGQGMKVKITTVAATDSSSTTTPASSSSSPASTSAAAPSFAYVVPMAASIVVSSLFLVLF